MSWISAAATTPMLPAIDQRPMPNDGSLLPRGGSDPMMVESQDDTRIDSGCVFGEGIFQVVDTGAKGPDNVRITIREDGSVRVEVNDRTFEFSAEGARNLRVRVDPDDQVQVDDQRPATAKAADPAPVQVFSYPR